MERMENGELINYLRPVTFADSSFPKPVTGLLTARKSRKSFHVIMKRADSNIMSSSTSTAVRLRLIFIYCNEMEISGCQKIKICC